MDNTDTPPTGSGEAPGAIVLHQVGIIRNGVERPFLSAGDDGIELRGEMDAVKDEIRQSRDAVSEIVIDEKIVEILDGIEEYSHIVVLYWAHRVPESSRALTRVHPMGRAKIPSVGIFSTCSPARPNPVLTSLVRLHEKRGNILRVSGLDAIDGSPVIDIKPFVKEFYDKKDVRIPAWMRKICDEMGDYYE
jgi:tRNA-Thr(GGU) m(6)t(6)A37 methyltransferase TsaA